MNNVTVIIKPIITEKSIAEAGTGRYSFVVSRDANKHQIADACAKMFNVTVKKVYTCTIKGTKTRWTRLGKSVTDTTYKKARVQVAKGQKIDLFETKKD